MYTFKMFIIRVVQTWVSFTHYINIICLIWGENKVYIVLAMVTQGAWNLHSLQQPTPAVLKLLNSRVSP